MLFRTPLAAGEGLVPRLLLRMPGLARRLPSTAGIGRVRQPPLTATRSSGRTITDVIAEMTNLGARLEAQNGADDGVLCFNRLYLAVTKAVQEAVQQPDYFSDPSQIAELDVLFAQLYFDVVDALERGEEPRTSAWRVLFEARSNPNILPIQFAAAGMNAHINHDLPIALLEQWERHGRRPSTTSEAYADFEKVNRILKKEELQLKPSFEQGLPQELDSGALGRLEDKLALWIVEDARARAWETAQHLWSVRNIPPLRSAWLTTVDGAVGALGTVLLDPV